MTETTKPISATMARVLVNMHQSGLVVRHVTNAPGAWVQRGEDGSFSERVNRQTVNSMVERGFIETKRVEFVTTYTLTTRGRIVAEALIAGRITPRKTTRRNRSTASANEATTTKGATA